jgi:hypothetical protein
MTMSGNGWSSNTDHDFSSAPQTTEDYEFNHQNKPAKAAIGIAILVVFALGLAWMKPATNDAANNPNHVAAQNTAHAPAN